MKMNKLYLTLILTAILALSACSGSTGTKPTKETATKTTGSKEITSKSPKKVDSEDTKHSEDSSEKADTVKLDEFVMNWQKDYKSLDPEKLKSYLDDDNHAFLKTYFAKFSKEQVEATKKMLKDQKTEIISSKVKGDTATVKMCCDVRGEEFTVYLNKKGDEWKVNFKKIIEKIS